MEPRFCSLTSNTVAPFQGGVGRDIKIKRREATLFGANGVVKIEPRSEPCFVEVTNRYKCFALAGSRFAAGSPPLQGGEFLADKVVIEGLSWALHSPPFQGGVAAPSTKGPVPLWRSRGG